MFNRKGNSYIEIMVVVAVLLIITLFAIPRYQTLRRDAFKAQVASDSRLVEAYVIEEYFHNGDMPTGSTLLSDDELKNLVTANRSYLRGNVLNSKDIDTLGGKKYKLNKKEVLKHINTQLTGDFVYTDKGVIYIDIISNKEDIDIEDLEKMIGPVKQMALGRHNSAVITESGELYTWGRDIYGQLGREGENNIPTKVSFLNNTKIKNVDLGEYHSVALTEDGSLYTWGDNWYGQLGLGDTSYKSRPTKVDGLSNVKQVSLGNYHSVALTKDGSIYTWGRNDKGQLGLGDNNIKSIDKPTKVCFSNNTKVKQIAIGTDHSAAITEDGDLYTWGRNDEGQLGLGDTRHRLTPVKVDSLSNVKQVALGYGHSAALTEDGSLYTWGRNNEGQLGRTGDDNIPTKVSFPDDAKVRNVALGYNHSVVLTEDGDLYAWGSNWYGQLGLGDRNNRLEPTKIDSLSNVKQVALGSYHSAALTKDRDLYTWGENKYDELGCDNEDERVLEPTKIEFFNKK